MSHDLYEEQQMSHHLVSACMALKTGSPISKLVLLKLADNADVHGMCFPSYDYLAQYCELSIRTVKNHIKQLETLGFVERIKRFDNRGRQRSNLYQLRIPKDSHIEVCSLRTKEEETLAPTEGAEMAPISSQKEKKKEKDKDKGEQTQPVINLPTTEGEQAIYDEFYQVLVQSYSTINVMDELNAMRAWLFVNPKKQRPPEHLGHFVNNWLRRSAKAKQSPTVKTRYPPTNILAPTTDLPIRAIDTLVEAHRQSGMKEPIEQRIQAMLERASSKKRPK